MSFFTGSVASIRLDWRLLFQFLAQDISQTGDLLLQRTLLFEAMKVLLEIDQEE